jgi:hypothetical protein
VPNDPNERLRLGMSAALAVIGGRPRGSRLAASLINGLVAAVRVRYGFRVLEAFQRDGSWWLRGVVNPPAELPIPEEDAELLRQIYEVADQEYAKARAAAVPAAPGTHEAPRVVPPGGLVTVAANLPSGLTSGRIDVLDVSQGASTPLIGRVQKPAFSGGDAIVSGASADERRVRIGRYSEVAATLSSVGNDRFVAQAATEVLRGGDLPASMRELQPWFGGFKTLMAQEVKRDPVALATLSSVLALAAQGALGISAAFAKAGEVANAATTLGGAFPHSATPALAPLRSAREAVGAPLPADAPASRGTKQQTGQVLTGTIDAITRAAQIVLKTKKQPNRTEILAAVQQVMRGLIGP